MGLDVHAYRHVQRLCSLPGNNGIDEYADYDYQQEAYFYDGKRATEVYFFADFPEHCAGLEPGVYTYADTLHLHAGAYSAYNRWRAWVSRVVLGVDPENVWRYFNVYRSRGAAWLVNFSDCEGFINADVAARIRDDLRTYEAALRATGDEWDCEKLDGWLALLDMAADEGFVRFG